MCEESDIKELGLPMGPRKKLLAFLKESKESQVNRLGVITYYACVFLLMLQNILLTLKYIYFL